MKKYLFTFLAISTALVSNDCTPCCDDPAPCCGTPFITVGGGYSWSSKASVTADPSVWDKAPQGYNADIGNSEFYTFGIGYHFHPLFSAVIDVTSRPCYEYSKFQTSSDESAPGSLGNKTRYFKLSNLAFMFSAYANKEGKCFSWCPCDITIAPVIGAGIGVSYNTVKDFHSVLPVPSGETLNPVRSIMQDNKRTSLGVQVMGGFLFQVKECTSFELGYRRFWGGRFETNNYLVDEPIGFDNPIKALAWKGYVRANELYLSLNINL